MKPAIIVTGAASGLGRELARIAARDAMSLVLLDRHREPLEALVSELRHDGVDAHALVADLGSPEAGEAVERMLSLHDLWCEVLVNNAGLTFVSPVLIGSLRQQLELVDVNVLAPTDLALRFLPAMIARRCGGILNVSSVGAYSAGPNMAVYNATKAYVSAFSVVLARQAAGSGVTVSCLVVGKMRTAVWVPSTKPRALMERLPESSARDIAEAAWRDFRRGKSLIIPQLFYRLARYALRVIPARWYVQLSSGWFGPIPDGDPSPGDQRPAVVVTGASRGIGRALAAQVSTVDSDVVLVGRSTEAFEDLADKLSSAGTRVHLLSIDLSQPAIGKVLERALAERNLYCDVLINGALIGLTSSARLTGLEAQMRLLAVNVRGLTELTLHFLPAMAARRRGRVLTLCSPNDQAEMASCPASGAYVASFSEALSCELKDRPVTVTCLRLRRNMAAEKIATAAWRGLSSGKALVAIGWRHRLLASNPLRRQA